MADGRAAAALVERITRLLEDGAYTTGERIGSERGLADGLGVTRSELRAALDALERAGCVRRTMGRTGGVFAWDGKIERQLNTVEGLPDMLRQQGVSLRTTVLAAELTLAGPTESRALRLDPGDTVFRLRRLREADGTPLSIDAMSIPSRLVPRVHELSLTDSVYRLLHLEFGIEAAEASETMDVTPADAEQAGLLGIEAGAPLFEIRRLTHDPAGTPFEYAHDLFRADRLRVTMRRRTPRWKRAPR